MIVKAETVFTDAGKQITVKVYPGAGRAFLNNTHGACHEAAAEDAWRMALDFFKRNLV